MSNPVEVLQTDSVTGLPVPQKSTNNAALVKEVGVSGAFATIASLVTDPTSPAYTNNQAGDANLAAKQIKLSVLQALVAAQPLLVGWDVAAGQRGVIGAKLDLLVAELNTPGTDTPLTLSNVVMISTVQELMDFELSWDGSDSATLIRSLAITSITATYTVTVKAVQ